ncbi:uncharacterized protein [Littorina saxatilis]|uniref:Galaxin-like repeats domain-containing protein n=1 Tax=Littorina saxatilis TaxID=31220 RepID=A0AAN9GA66_9CAEN
MPVTLMPEMIKYSLFFVCLSTTVETAASERDGHRSRLQRGHGDPCGPSLDASLVCCIGLHESTLMRQDEECCNGRPTGVGHICCAGDIAVPVASSNHDACCINPSHTRGITFDSTRFYCSPRTGQIQRLPFSKPQPSNALNTFPESSSSSSSSLSSLVSSFHRWCEAGLDENRSDGPRWEGERVLCCGGVSYFASRQICCSRRLHDLPTEDAQCCYDQAFQKEDPSNPCLGRCGPNTTYDSHRELCCDGVVHQVSSIHDVCCGRNKISSETHVCCAEGTVALPRDGPHRCCREAMPYVKRYMRCNRQGRRGKGRGRRRGRRMTGGLRRKRGAQFQTSTFCRRSLPEWGSDWPSPRLMGGAFQIEGSVTKVKKNQTHIRLTLTPFRVIRQGTLHRHDNANIPCLQSEELQVIASLETTSNRRKCRGRQLRRYLRGSTLTVFSPLTSVVCNDSSILVPSSSPEFLVLKAR